MASRLMVKNTILSVSKGNMHSIPISLSSTNKLSQVCFTSASGFNRDRYGKEDAGADEDAKVAERIREARLVYEKDEEAEEVERKYREMKQSAKDTTHNMKEGAKDTARDMKEGAKDAMGRAKDTAGDTMDRTADKTKEGAGKAAKGAQNVGEKVKETAKGAWETAKDATHRMKEKVVGEDDDDKKMEDYVEDHLPKHPRDGAKDNQTRRGL